APSWFEQLAPNAPPDSAATTDASAERMRRELVRFFENLALVHPVVISIDDIHWADASTCDLLAYLAVRLEHAPLFVITASRPADVAGQPFRSARQSLERREQFETIPLSSLTVADVEQYLDRRFPSNAFATELAAIVHERTEGHPLFMRDM